MKDQRLKAHEAGDAVGPAAEPHGALLDPLIRNCCDGLWEWPDLSCRRMWWSEGLYRLLGYRPGACVPSVDLLEELLHPDDLNAGLTAQLHRADKGEPFESEWRLRTASGEYRWFRTRGMLFGWNGGPATAMAGAMHDVTECRGARDELRAERDRMRAYLGVVGVIVVALDTDGCITMMNPYGAELLGCDPGEVIGLNWFDRFVPEEEREEARRLFGELMGDRLHLAEKVRNRVRTCSGDMRVVAWTNTLLREADGRITGTLSSGTDITDQIEAEAREREAMSRLRLAMESANEGTWEWDCRSGQVKLDEVALRMIGFEPDKTPESLLWWTAFLHPDDRPQTLRRLEAIANGETDRYSAEFRMRARDASAYRWIASNACVVRRDEQGKPLLIVGIRRDITERKEALKALNEASMQLNAAVEAGNIGLWDWNLETDEVLYSNQWKRQLGCSAEDVTTTIDEWERRVHPDDLAPMLDHLRCCIAEGRARFQAEYRLRHAEGCWLWVLSTASIVRDADGRALRVMGANVDITERKEAEQALAKSEELLRETGEMALVGGWEIDLATGNVVLTDTARKIIELPAGRSISVDEAIAMFPGEVRDEVRAALRDAIEDGRSFDLERPFVTAAGSPRWMRAFGVPLVQDGVCVRLHGSAQDVTQRREAEEAMAESERKYRLLADNTVDCIWIMDLDTTVQYVNPAIRDLLGYAPEEVIGRKLGELCDAENLAQFEKTIQKTLAGLPDLDTAQVEAQLLHRDGHAVDVEITGRIVCGEDGIPGTIQGVARDTTERKKSEAERRILEAQLRQAQKMEAIGQLAGGVAHDFNNILQGMIGYCNLLKFEVEKDTEAWEFVEELAKGTDRASALTRQLLTFSRKDVTEPKDIDLNLIVQDLTKMIGRTIGEQIRLVLRLAEEEVPAHADPGQVEQVLMNLCVNARDAMPEGGELIVETGCVVLDDAFVEKRPWAEKGRYACMCVTDTGFGMDELTKSQIFEPFFTTKEAGKGTGLGLATVYGIVKQHRGMIDVQSDPGLGTTFRVYLPLAEHAAAVEPQEEEEPPTAGGRETILLAEDDPVVRRLAIRMLEKAGYRVLATADGDEAIRLLEQRAGEVDLAVLDVVMPKRTGKDVFEFFRSKKPDGRAVFMSGYSAGLVDAEYARNMQLTLIPKPFSSDALLQAIREALDGRAATA